MKITVCVKIIKGEINPFDACALEEALKIKGAEITLLCMGNTSCLDELRRLSRLDVCRAILLCDSALAGSDTLCTSYALSKAIEKIGADAVFCGRQTIDGDTAQTGPMLSCMLSFNLITNVLEITSVNGDGCVCKSAFGTEKAAVPYLITVERINNLRFPRIRSQIKEPEIWSLDDIGADKSKCGLENSPTKVLQSFESPSGKRKCTFIDISELENVVSKELKKERAIKEAPKASAVKLPSVTVIGSELTETAKNLSDNVRVLEKDDVQKLLPLIKDENVVLWKADLWGRKNAPVAAAMLGTGLCADCIKLETDGEGLFMYRPAFGESLIAKIACRTKPQMATVRLEDTSESAVIVASGRGVLGKEDKIKQLAEKLGASICASRAAVDSGNYPYTSQVGLTGKRVSPKIYIAIGISGAVQHTCAIESSGVIIAINKDKNAPIFDYCDYGIVYEF